jgi:bifunctional non-homologous end joining protein LigD
MPEALAEYEQKRHFERTPEPPPAEARGEGPLRFVVHKHAARRLHYDLRLELDGVLKSWAVPKGPSVDPAEKRLAVEVEDHPLDYGSFEGVIPKGEYGAGEVIIWDSGTYSPDEGGRLSFDDRNEAQRRMRRDLDSGKLSITLRGHKLHGSWTLVRTARAENEWLLIKHADEYAERRDVLSDNRSVVSDLTVEDLRAGHLPVALVPVGRTSGAEQAPFPATVEPMLAAPADKPFSSSAWLFEPKLDGLRALALIDAGKVRLLSRRGLDITHVYPALVGELAQHPANQLILDGELVALDENLRPSFEVLQQRMNLQKAADIARMDAELPVYYYVFDLLYQDGFDLRGVQLELRKQLLARALQRTTHVRPMEHFDDGHAAFDASVKLGMDGMLAKRRDSIYESGRRSRRWLKIKAYQEQDLLVGGFSQGTGARANTFGALIVGYYDDQGCLVYAGHVGSGFDDRTLRSLLQHMRRLEVRDCPFAQQPPLRGAATWLRPKLVVEVRFSNWTREGYLRHPVFVRTRDHKLPAEVRRHDVVDARDEASVGVDQLDADIDSVLQQLEIRRANLSLDVAGHRIELTNLDKEFWPALPDRRALTKRDLLVYLARVAPYILPHLRDRLLSLTRYPNGIHGGHFYQKHYEHELPEYVHSARFYSGTNEGDVEYLICDNLPTLLWLGQLADLEIHPWFSRVNPEPDAQHLPLTLTGSRDNVEASLLNYPDFLAFDLDPYIYSGREAKGDEPELNRRAFAKTCEIAHALRAVLQGIGLSSFVKTSGKTGLHVYVPIVRNLDFDAVRRVCETLAQHIEQAHRGSVTTEWVVEKRSGKVFIDYNQNIRGKTLASIYSPRPVQQAAVSMPLRWDELDEVYPTDFTLLTAPDRLAEVGDLWAGILNAKHDLSAVFS